MKHFKTTWLNCMVELLQIELSNEPAVYLAGKRLDGRVTMSLSRPCFVRSVRLYCTGEAFTKRAEARANGSSGAAGQHLTLHAYSARETYVQLSQQMPTMSATLQPGQYAFPFWFQLPGDCPQSFEGNGGSVRYGCKLELQYDSNERKLAKVPFTVLNGVDLNAPTRKPTAWSSELQLANNDCPHASYRLQVPSVRLVPGDRLTTHLKMVRVGKTDKLDLLQAQLVQRVSYTGYSSNTVDCPIHWEERTLVKQNELKQKSDQRKVGVTSVDWSPFRVPAVAPTMDAGCSIIRVQYELLYHVATGKGKRQTFVVPITVGVVPQQCQWYRFLANRPVQQQQSVGHDQILQPLLKQYADLPLPMLREHVTKPQDVRSDYELNCIDQPIYYKPYTVVYQLRDDDNADEAEDQESGVIGHQPFGMRWRRTRSVASIPTVEYR